LSEIQRNKYLKEFTVQTDINLLKPSSFFTCHQV